MTVVLTHVGSDIPLYCKIQWKQLRYYDPKITIYFIGQKESLIKEKENLNKYNIIPIEAEQFEDNELIKEFRKIQWYDVWGSPNTKYPSPPLFVVGTSLRLYVLNAFIEKYNIKNVIHLENDILIYNNLQELIRVFEKIYNKFTCTIIQDYYACCGFIYIPQSNDLKNVCLHMLQMLYLGDSGIKQKYPQIEMVHEMPLIYIYNDKSLFPILPTHQYYEDINILIEGCSIGQYITGTNCHAHGIGYISLKHYVGQKIADGTYTPKFINKKPILVENKTGIEHKIANLHVHSKQLHLYTSY